RWRLPDRPVDDAMRRQEEIVGDDALRTGALHSDHPPIVDDGELVALQQNMHVDGLAVGADAHRAAEQVSRHVTAGGVVPGAVAAPAALGRNHRRRGADSGTTEFAVAAIS